MPIMDGIEACNKIHSFMVEENLLMNMKLKKKKDEDNALKEKEALEIIEAIIQIDANKLPER